MKILDLLNAGYKEFPSNKPGSRAFQKTVRNAAGDKLYFINAYQLHLESLEDFQYFCEVRLYQSLHRVFDLNLIVRVADTGDTIEAFYADAYKRMGCIPDADNNR